jgi:signal peptidase I
MTAANAPPRFREVCADLLRAGHPVRFVATGNSMTPAIRDGDRLTVEPLASHAARPGDVVLYLSPHGVTAHRVVGLGSTVLRCQGDAAGSQEESVPAEEVLGKVLGIERLELTGAAGPSGPRRLLSGLRARIRVFLRLWRARNRINCPTCHQSGRVADRIGAVSRGRCDTST